MERFADRLDPADLAAVREYAEVGERGEEIGLLLACLRAARPGSSPRDTPGGSPTQRSRRPGTPVTCTCGTALRAQTNRERPP